MPIGPSNSGARGVLPAFAPEVSSQPPVATTPSNNHCIYQTPLVESLVHYLDDLPPAGGTEGKLGAKPATTVSPPSAARVESAITTTIVKTGCPVRESSPSGEELSVQPAPPSTPTAKASTVTPQTSRQSQSSDKFLPPKLRGKSRGYYLRIRNMDRKIEILSSLNYTVLSRLFNALKDNPELRIYHLSQNQVGELYSVLVDETHKKRTTVRLVLPPEHAARLKCSTRARLGPLSTIFPLVERMFKKAQAQRVRIQAEPKPAAEQSATE